MPSRKRVLFGAVVVSLVATAALAIGILIFSSFGHTAGRVLLTTMFVAVAAFLALPGATLLDQGRLLVLARATVGLALAELALATAAVWAEAATPGRLAGSGFVVTFVAAQTSALAARRTPADPRAVDRLFVAATAAVVVLAGLVLRAIWAETAGSGYLRAVGVVAVVDVLLVVLQPVLRRGREPAPARVHKLRLTLDDGSTVDDERAGGDFADAAARAIRNAERTRGSVRTLERLD